MLALGLALLVIALGAAFVTMGNINEDTARVEHTLKVEASINRLAAFNEQIETGRRGFIIQPGDTFAKVVEEASKSFDAEHARLAELTSDNPRQARKIAELADLKAQRAALLQQLIASPQATAGALRATDFDSDMGVRLTRRIRAQADRMAAEEAELLRVRTGLQYGSLVRFYLVGGTATFLLISVMGTVILLILRYNRDLAATQERLRFANEGLETAVSARTIELVRANQEIQRFAYIVSHDLRSPLVNVLGFTAELDEARKTIHKYLANLFEKHPGLRDEAAWLAVEEDLPEAVGFIRTSTEKMDRLISSILALSRQGRRQLNPEMLDMNALAEAVVSTLFQRTQDAGATITVRPIPPVESDRMAIEQILSNLVENALKYLSPDRAGQITIEGSREGPMVLVDVTDNGRGIAPADHERIFELFRRAGSQDQPGEGIGLANVRALAYRLGGNVEVDSQLDQGARFRLSVPAKFVATETTA
ncbi:ATP-binding protein [Novosphingobium tardum]|uniref:histidine kinase n=1 Tax=Novosphingobium tardum TaxID=1538021 RepID=A0ABV8RPC0_9SPHN